MKTANMKKILIDYESQNGFTLLEIMVALFIFAIVTTISLIGMKNVIETQQIIETHVANMNEMQLAMIIMQRDFSQVIDRTITDQNNQQQHSLMGNNNYIEFTRSGYINPMASSDRSEMQRVAYFVKNNQLIRMSWAELDRTQNTPAIQKVLIDNVYNLHFTYLDYQGVFHDQWPLSSSVVPSTQNSQVSQQQLPTLPRAVDVLFSFTKSGQLERFFVIPGVGFNGYIPS